MKIFVKNKFASLGGSSKVTDENGNDIFRVKGKLFSIRRKKKIYNMDKKLLYVVRNKFFNWWKHTSFIFNSEGMKIAKVANRAIKGGYDVLGYTDEIAIDGWGLGGYTILKNGQTVGAVKSNFMSLVDNFEVTIQDGEDPAFIVALIIAIDNIKDKSSKVR